MTITCKVHKIDSQKNLIWFQPIWKIFVKLEIFPNFRGENVKYLKPPTRDDPRLSLAACVLCCFSFASWGKRLLICLPNSRGSSNHNHVATKGNGMKIPACPEKSTRVNLKNLRCTNKTFLTKIYKNWSNNLCERSVLWHSTCEIASGRIPHLHCWCSVRSMKVMIKTMSSARSKVAFFFGNGVIHG